MKKKPIFSYEGIIFDSNEQIDFYKWLTQCKENNLVTNFIYHPESFKLFEQGIIHGKTILRPHIYTADFLIQFDKQFFQNSRILKNIFKYSDDEHYVDIKGGFNSYGSHTDFSINRKWVFSLYQKYVYKIQIDPFFEKTFIPEKSRYTQKLKKLRQKYKYFKTINQYIEQERRKIK